jgi:hypothetical protein
LNQQFFSLVALAQMPDSQPFLMILIFIRLWNGCRRPPVRRPHPNRVQGRRGDPVHVRSHEPLHA